MLLIDETKIRRTLLERCDEDDNSNAAVVDGKKYDCYALGVALCEYFQQFPEQARVQKVGSLVCSIPSLATKCIFENVDDILRLLTLHLYSAAFFEETLQTGYSNSARSHHKTHPRDALEMFSEVMRNNNKWCHGM